MSEKCAQIVVDNHERVSVMPMNDTHRMRIFQVELSDGGIICRALVRTMGPDPETAEAIQYITPRQCMAMAKALRTIAIKAFEEEYDE